MSTVYSGNVCLSGIQSSSAGSTGSVASASAENVSIMSLIHNSWTTDGTDVSELETTAVTKLIMTAVTLVEI